MPAISENPIPDVTTRVKLPSKRDVAALEDVFESAKGTDLDEDLDVDLPEEVLSGPRADGSVPELTDVGEIVGGGDTDVVSFETIEPSEGPAPVGIESLEEIQASANAKRPQGELALDGGPKGKFEGEDPNLLEGEDLDIPPFLRNQK